MNPVTNPDPEVVGNLIRSLRISQKGYGPKGMTQLDLANKLSELTGSKTQPGTISVWERGERLPETPYLHALGQVFSISIDALLAGEVYGGPVGGSNIVRTTDLENLLGEDQMTALSQRDRFLLAQFLSEKEVDQVGKTALLLFLQSLKRPRS